MGYKTLCLGLCCILFAYYIHTQLPEDIEERWKVGILDAVMKTFYHTGMFLENIGFMNLEELFATLASLDNIKPMSDENLTVIYTTFSDIPVCLYLPKRKSERKRPAVIFIHGGAFVLGSCKMASYDFLSRMTANKLDAVVVGVDYRLAPQYKFPVCFEDCVSVAKFFLQDEILAKYGVDPSRICVSGDSSGGHLVALVTQLLRDDPEFKDKIKAQALIYPALQFIDIFMPSHQENLHGPVLSREMAIKITSLYLSRDKVLVQAFMDNQHMPQGSRHLFKFVNWSVFLPEKYKKNHVYQEPILGQIGSLYPELMDSRLSPMMVNDSQLQNLPLTYVLTCQHDILRDDGLIYVSRLQRAGVQVTHEHMEKGIHGAMSFMGFPINLRLGNTIKDKYLSWLEENL